MLVHRVGAVHAMQLSSTRVEVAGAHSVYIALINSCNVEPLSYCAYPIKKWAHKIFTRIPFDNLLFVQIKHN